MSPALPGRPGGPRVRLVPGALQIASTAAGCPDWPALEAAASTCTACPELAAHRTQVVNGDVPPGVRARLALLGEAPGAEEDVAGHPFVGKAGKLLNELLAEAGLDRSGLAVLNAARCRPPGNRTPKPDELARCRGWLDRSIELVGPELIVTLGRTAATVFLGKTVKLGEARGRIHTVGELRILPTYHPSAAIRFGPNGKPRAHLAADLKLAAASLAGAGR